MIGLLLKILVSFTTFKFLNFKCLLIKYGSDHFMGYRWGNSGNSVRLNFGAPKFLQMVIAAMKLKDTYSLEGKL